MRKMIYVGAALMLFVACNKYEDGPEFSLHSKTQRISNNWKIETVFDNDANATLDFCAGYPGYQLNIGSDKKYTITYKISEQQMFVEKGSWKFNDDKTHIVLTSESGKEVDYTITRLERNDLRVRYNCETGAERKVNFIPKTDG